MKKKKKIIYLFLLLLFTALLAGGILKAKNIYSYQSEIGAEILDRDEIKEDNSIVVQFYGPILQSSAEKDFSIAPAVDFETSWKNGETLVIKPKDLLRPETNYEINFSGLKSSWYIPQKEIKLGFSTPNMPALEKVAPQNGQVEVEQYGKINLDFDKSVTRQFFIEVRISPEAELDYSFDQERKNFVISPKNGFSEGVEYKLGVSLTHKYYRDIKKDLYQGTFKTKEKPKEVVYGIDSNGSATKVEDKKELVTAQITEGKYIDIDISSQTLYIFENGSEKGAYKISSGKRGMDTPQGTFSVLGKSKKPWSQKYKLFMPWFIGFTNQGHGIHELPEWPGGYKEGANHLGIPVSHGCVRLGVGPAKIVYDFVEKGTPIVVHQ